MTVKHEITSSDHATPLNPKVQEWRAQYQIHNQARQPINPSHLMLDGPGSQPLENLDETSFNRLFFQMMAQGVALDDEQTPHFFHPKSFLQDANRRIFRKGVDLKTHVNALNSIVLFKNLPEYQDNSTLQQDARAAIAEYLDPALFAGSFAHKDDLFTIFTQLNSEAVQDPVIMDCLNAVTTEINQSAYSHQAYNREQSRSRAQKTGYNSAIDYTPNPGSFIIDPNTTIDDLLDNLRHSPNRAGFERINAIRRWGDFIKEHLGDANYEEEVVTFGSTSPTSRYTQYSNDNTYAVIAFDYKGRRCMIAESCGSGGANSTSAAMKVWRSDPKDINDKQGWIQAFAQSKSRASNQGLLRDIRHFGLAAAATRRGDQNEHHIVEAEDRLFRAALHFFETGNLVGGGENAARELDQLIGPQMWRPNPASDQSPNSHS